MKVPFHPAPHDHLTKQISSISLKYLLIIKIYSKEHAWVIFGSVQNDTLTRWNPNIGEDPETGGATR